LFEKAGLDPAVHIVNGNKKDNFWMMGDTGPCGPCSELHIDLTPAGDTRGALVNAGDPRTMEIWNLVFIQFNANADGSFTPLPAKHVDTGMGFERATGIIQGTKGLTDFTGTISNYETDVFRPIFDEIEKLSGKRYTSTLPKPGSTGDSEQEKIDVAFRVIADHIRTLSFAVADGIQPSNEGRGYVLRRILRRAVRYGRTLGFHEPFFFQLVDVLVRTMGKAFPELCDKQELVRDTLRREEDAFNRTLDRGIDLFERETASGQSITAEFAFRLYDEQGFPLDLTELMARERGLTVDVAGFEKLMNEQRERARKAQKKDVISVLELGPAEKTDFVGYERLSDVAEILYVKQGVLDALIVPSRSPFYASMGGQVADTGSLRLRGSRYGVSDVQKQGERYLLKLDRKLEVDDLASLVGETAELEVEEHRRSAIQRHHTVTHLLHWALHKVVSRDAVQKGSYVGPEKLTFDFSSAALTPHQVRDVEKLVNERISEDAPVSWTEIPYAEAKQRSDIQQFFGDKYGETVRVVQIGSAPNALNGYSMELCGGTHVRNTGDIGAFKIVSEGAIAAGIRRIEAVAGDEVLKWADREAAKQEEKFAGLSRKKSGLAALPAHSDVVSIEARAGHLKQLETEVLEWEKQQAKAAEAELRSRGAKMADEIATQHASSGSVVAQVPDADGALLQAIVDRLKSKVGVPILLAGATNGRVDIVASVPSTMTEKLRANDLVQQVAMLLGGKGGGRPDNARGSGKDPSKLADALAKARELIGG
jgi:alanyl-tRNA synthetase